jgi:hypothetical protein
VVDEDGRRLGRLATAYGNYTPDLYHMVWLVVRLPGIRRRWRAIPARQACWDDAAQIRNGGPKPIAAQPTASPHTDRK